MASQYLYFVKHAVCLPWDPRASCQKWVLKGCSFDNKARNVTIYMTATNGTSRNSFEDFRPPSQLQVVFSRFSAAAVLVVKLEALSSCNLVTIVIGCIVDVPLPSCGYNTYIPVYGIKVHTNDIAWMLGGCRKRVTLAVHTMLSWMEPQIHCIEHLHAYATTVHH